MATTSLTAPEPLPLTAPSPQPAALIQAEVYLQTSYRPDRELIEGQLLERNVGEIPHSRLQGFFYWIFRSREADWGFSALTEARVQVTPTRYRVPDVCIVPFHITDKRIVRTPPVLCIEILSPEDRMSEMQERVDDYLHMGVGTVWVIDPMRRKAFIADAEGQFRSGADTLHISGTAVELGVTEIFAELDRYEA